MIAALFVEKNGCYSKLDNIDLWCKDRDARNYLGPYPVVAHPPCNLWTRFAIVNFIRWGGDHNKPRNDNGCFKSALQSIKKFGGVLEHPAFSYAWDEYDLPRPKVLGWQKHGDIWICEVWQSAYGHKARKRTWLIYSGKNDPFELNWDRPNGTHQIGGFDQRGKDRNKPTISGKAASATPISFRDELLLLAKQAMQ